MIVLYDIFSPCDCIIAITYQHTAPSKQGVVYCGRGQGMVQLFECRAGKWERCSDEDLRSSDRALTAATGGRWT